MKSIFIIICLALFVITGCRKDGILEDTPTCIKDKITKMQNESVTSPPSKVYEYTYKKQLVYFIPQFCCDFPSELYDENCTLICEPDGGFTGNGDGKCTDFFKKRTGKRLVWADPRE